MTAPTTKAKVYYLPVAEPVTTTHPVSRWAGVRRRLLRAWWTARLSLAGLRPGLWRRRRRRRAGDYAALLRDVIGDSPAELIDRRRSKPSRPATVLDFEAARLRLRPATG